MVPAARGLLLVLSIAPSWARGGEPSRAAVALVGKRSEEKTRDPLIAQIRRALEERRDVVLLSPSDEVRLFRGSPPGAGRSAAGLSQARRLVKQAAKSFSAFELQDAVRSVTKAREMLEGWIGLRAALEVDRERLHLAIAIAHAERDEQRLLHWFTEYALRFPNDPPPPSLWPPDLMNKMKGMKGATQTTLTVRSEPTGRVFVDGREIGPSPIRIGALPAGAHRVEVEAPGHFVGEAWVETTKDVEAAVDVALSPDVSSTLERIDLEGTLDASSLRAIQEVSASGGLELLFLVGFDRGGQLRLARLAIGSAREAVPGRPALALARLEPTPEGIRGALRKLLDPPLTSPLPSVATLGVASSAQGDAALPVWGWIAGGAGVVAAVVGIAIRLEAVGTHDELVARGGSLTQAEAFQLRDRGEAEARSGALLLGFGLAAVAGIAGWWVVELDPFGGAQ